MSSSRPVLSRRAFLASVGAAGLLAGCTDVRPLYAPVTAGGTSPSADALRHIDIEPATERVAQQVRNELIFGFTGGGEPAQPLYRLSLRSTDGAVPVGVEKYQHLPASYLLSIEASFRLTEISTGRVMFHGTAFANAPYDFSSSRFANQRAKLDAQDRAAVIIAGDIRTRIATWFANHPNGA